MILCNAFPRHVDNIGESFQFNWDAKFAIALTKILEGHDVRLYCLALFIHSKLRGILCNAVHFRAI